MDFFKKPIFWIILLIIALVVVSIFAFGKGKNDKQGEIPPYVNQLPSHCDPYRPGYDKNGYQDPFCGNVPPGYLSECDPDRPGYDIYGFADAINCGFGRKRN